MFLGVSPGSAQPSCSFHGFWDLNERTIDIFFQFPQKGNVHFLGKQGNAKDVDFRIDFEKIEFLLFDITTQLSGTANVPGPWGPGPAVEGVLGDGKTSADESASNTFKGKFRIAEDKIFFENCVWGGLTLQGSWSFVFPYAVDLSVDARRVSLADLFSWMGQKSMSAQGEVSGQVRLSGIRDCLKMKGTFSSQGEVDGFRYDSITAYFEGFYPVVKLANASVTQEDGVSFFLEGDVDLSKDLEEFGQQLARMKMQPLIRETDVDREWTIRRQIEGKRSNETEFKYRLRKERETSGIDESGLLSIQHSIKF